MSIERRRSEYQTAKVLTSIIGIDAVENVCIYSSEGRLRSMQHTVAEYLDDPFLEPIASAVCRNDLLLLLISKVTYVKPDRIGLHPSGQKRDERHNAPMSDSLIRTLRFCGKTFRVFERERLESILPSGRPGVRHCSQQRKDRAA